MLQVVSGRKKSLKKGARGKGKGLMGKLGLDDDYPEKKGKEVKIDKSFQTGMGSILVKFSRYFIFSSNNKFLNKCFFYLSAFKVQ